MIYMDSCALVKLLNPEIESNDLMAFLGSHANEAMTSSELARVEVVRAVIHLGSEFVNDAKDLIDTLDLIPMETPLLRAAADIDFGVLRSLDAIHLATAVSLGISLTTFISYDKRLLLAAKDANLPVDAPGTGL